MSVLYDSFRDWRAIPQVSQVSVNQLTLCRSYENGEQKVEQSMPKKEIEHVFSCFFQWN